MITHCIRTWADTLYTPTHPSTHTHTHTLTHTHTHVIITHRVEGRGLGNGGHSMHCMPELVCHVWH